MNTLLRIKEIYMFFAAGFLVFYPKLCALEGLELGTSEDDMFALSIFDIPKYLFSVKNKDLMKERVKKIYKFLSLKFHPDRPSSPAQGTEIFQGLSKAYTDVMSDRPLGVIGGYTPIYNEHMKLLVEELNLQYDFEDLDRRIQKLTNNTNELMNLKPQPFSIEFIIVYTQLNTKLHKVGKLRETLEENQKHKYIKLNKKTVEVFLEKVATYKPKYEEELNKIEELIKNKVNQLKPVANLRTYFLPLLYLEDIQKRPEKLKGPPLKSQYMKAFGYWPYSFFMNRLYEKHIINPNKEILSYEKLFKLIIKFIKKTTREIAQMNSDAEIQQFKEELEKKEAFYNNELKQIQYVKSLSLLNIQLNQLATI